MTALYYARHRKNWGNFTYPFLLPQLLLDYALPYLSLSWQSTVFLSDEYKLRKLKPCSLGNSNFLLHRKLTVYLFTQSGKYDYSSLSSCFPHRYFLVTFLFLLLFSLCTILQYLTCRNNMGNI